MEMVLPIILAAISSAGLFGFLQYLISRHDGRKATMDRLAAGMTALQKDSIRTQLLLLIADYPQDRSEILRLAELYFKDLEGNFYMSSIFAEWLSKNKIAVPGWFKG